MPFFLLNGNDCFQPVLCGKTVSNDKTMGVSCRATARCLFLLYLYCFFCQTLSGGGHKPLLTVSLRGRQPHCARFFSAQELRSNDFQVSDNEPSAALSWDTKNPAAG